MGERGFTATFQKPPWLVFGCFALFCYASQIVYENFCYIFGRLGKLGEFYFFTPLMKILQLRGCNTVHSTTDSDDKRGGWGDDKFVRRQNKSPLVIASQAMNGDD